MGPREPGGELPEPRAPIWEPRFDLRLPSLDLKLPSVDFGSRFEALNRQLSELITNPAPLPGGGSSPAKYLFPLGLVVLAAVVGRELLKKPK